MERWTIKSAEKAYNIDNWGDGYFSINRKGHVCVHPSPHSKYAIDLRALMDDPSRRAELGRKGREAVRRDYSDEAMARRTLAVYERYLES